MKSKKGSIISDYFKLLEDVGALKSGNMYDLALYDEYLGLTSMFAKQEVRLKYNQITDVFYGRKSELIEQNKSVIGRAIVGGVLLGGVGAVVGGLSGTGKKLNKVTLLYLIISYKDSNGEDKILQFEDTRKYKGKKIAQQLKELADLKSVEDQKILDL